MGRTVRVLLIALAVAACLVGMGKNPAAEEAPRMAKDELKARLDGCELVVIDVRAAGHWQESDRKIAGARREEPAAPEKWAGSYPREKTLVLYCA